MATLQKLRNAGPLLLIFVGLALLAFVAGDALRIFQSPQGSQPVGSVNGEEITAADYQKLYEEYSNVVQFMRGVTTLSEAEQNQIKDEAWGTYINHKMIENEANKLGLTVTVAELQDIVSKGEHFLLQQSPFRNEQGKFDIDILNQFLSSYDENKDDAAFVQQYKPIYDYWKFIEKTIMQNALADKYHALVRNSFISNPVLAENNYNRNNSTYNIEYKVYPYSAMADSTVKVSDSDIKRIYEEEKETYKQFNESRDIKYVSFRVTPSAEDRAHLQSELAAYADSLKSGDADYATIARLSATEVPYSTLGWAKDIYPEEVGLRLDSVEENSVTGPIYNQYDDSYTVFKYLGKETIADSIQYRNIAISAQTAERAEEIADSLIKELNKGADFAEIAAKYGQNNTEAQWLTSVIYEGAPGTAVNAEFLNALFNAEKNKYSVFAIKEQPARFIYQVLDKRNPETKYHAVVVKRTSEFSSETYNEAYNKFSQFVASCKTTEDLEKNAEEYGYRVMAHPSVFNNTYNIANISGSREAVRWLYNDANVGEISPLYECGNNDNLLVITMTGVNEKGYVALEKRAALLRTKAIKEKKAEKIIAELNGKNFDELANIANVKSDVAERITFSAPAFMKAISSSEPAICAAVTKLQPGEVSAPIKGEGGVYVIKLTAKNSKGTSFNSDTEQATLKDEISRTVSRYIAGDMYEKAEVTDNRYLYF